MPSASGIGRSGARCRFDASHVPHEMTTTPFADRGRRARTAISARHRGLAAVATLACAAATGAPAPATHQRAHVTTVKIVSDLPLSGDGRAQTQQMVRAIRFVLQQANFKAGNYRVQFESHDDALAATGEWAESRCSHNARAFVADPAVVGVIGTFNSGCSALEIPILNRAALAMVSPGNTYAGLTKAAIGNAFGEPASYYPAGGRNYTRVVPSDDNEGRVAAGYMKRTLHATKVFVLNDRSDYGRLTASTFEEQAKQLGLKIVGHDGWDRSSSSYVDLMTRIKATGANGLYIAGDEIHNGARLIKDKVAVLGPQRQGQGRRHRRLRLPLAAARGRRVDDGRDRRHLARRARRPARRCGRPLPRRVREDRGRRADPRLDDLRGRCDPGSARRDRALRRHPQGRGQEAVRHEPGEDGARADVVRRQRRSALAVEALYRATQGKWLYFGSQSYESTVKTGKVAGTTRKPAPPEATHPARDVYYAPYLPKADRFTGESILETRLSAAAYKLSQFIGSPKTIDVACWSRWDWPRVADDDDIYSTFGFWMGDMPHWVHLSPETCRGIETLLHNRPAFPNAFTADAVQTLSHEMMHALGVDSEAEAECLGMQVSAVLAAGSRRAEALRAAARAPQSRELRGPAAGVHRPQALSRRRRLGPARERALAALACRLSERRARRRKCRLLREKRWFSRDYCGRPVGRVLWLVVA